MELIKDTINVCNITAKGVSQAMADGDVIVPDVKPDILKLLQVDAQACITDKYIENGRLVINGRVDYKILYVPDSGEHKIKSILTSMDFRQAVDSGGADADAKLLVKPFVDKVEFNTVNSRKMRIRTIIHLEYEVCRLNSFEVLKDVVDEKLEKEYTEVEFENTVDISEHTFTINDRIEVPNGAESIGEILKTDVKIYDTEYKALSGKVIVKGNAGICVLYTDNGGDIRFLEAEIPFTEIVDSESINDDTVCDIDYCILGGMCSVEPDNDGDLRVCNIDTDVCVILKGVELTKKEIIKDCYMPYKKTSCNKEQVKLKTSVERPRLQNTLREVIELPKNLPGITGIYNVMSNAIITKTETQRNKIFCEGKVETYILYLTDSAENPVYSYKKEIPFSYIIECENDTEQLMCEIKAGVKHVSYNLNSNGEIELRCMLGIECVITKENQVNNICSIDIEDKNSDDSIIVCFVEKGEKAWDIAKKYTVPKEKLLLYNNLDDDIIPEGKKIFIPMR